jgi:hypothetical protein
VQRRGGRGGGAGARRGPSGGWGGGRHGVEVDAEEEREHGVDPAAVGEAPTVEAIGEAVGEASAVEA